MKFPISVPQTSVRSAYLNQIRAALFMAFLLCLGHSATAANRYWVAASASNWNNIANWSSTSGGAGGSSIPNSADAVYFDNAATGNCLMDINILAGSLNVATGYTGTLAQTSNSLTLLGTAVFAGGTFNGGSSDIIVYGSFTNSGTAFTSTSGILELRGDAAFTGGSFAHNNGSVKLNGTGLPTLTGISPTFYNLEFVGRGNTFNMNGSGNVVVLNSLNTSAALFYNISGGTIEVKGNINSSNTHNGSGGDATILINGTGNQSFTGSTVSGTGALPKLIINKPSGTLSLFNYPAAANDFTYTAGTVNAGTSTFCFTRGNTGTYTITGNPILQNILFKVNTSGLAATVASGSSLTALGDFSIGGTGNMVFSSGDIFVNGNLNLTNTSQGGGGSGYLNLIGSGSQTIDGSAVTVGQNKLPRININKSGGTLYMTGNISFASSVTYLAGTIDPGTSTCHIVGNLTLTGSFSLYNLTMGNGGNTTTTIDPASTITVTNNYYMEGANYITTNTGTLALKGNLVDNNTSTIGGGTTSLLFNGTGNQSITTTGVLEQGKLPGVTINKPSGTLTFPALTNVVGNWTYTAGTMDLSTNNSSIVFANTLSIGGNSHSLNNVRFHGSNNFTFTINSGTVLSVTGTLSTTGTNNIFFQTAVAGTTAIQARGDINIGNTSVTGGGMAAILINGAGNQTLSSSSPAGQGMLPYLKIQKPSGTLSLAGILSVSRDFTWLSGTVDAGISTMVFGGNSLSVTSSGMSFYNVTASSNNITLANSLTLSNDFQINAGAGLVIPTAVTLHIAGLLNNNGTITSLGTVNFNGTSGIQTFFGVPAFYNLTVSNASGLRLPANVQINNDLQISSGALQSNNFPISIKGSWLNNASTSGFSAGTSTVSFIGTAAQSIGGSFSTTFNNLIIANTASTVGLNGNQIVVGDLTISSGILDIGIYTLNRNTAGGALSLANGTTLKIGGTNSFPSNYTGISLQVASTVDYAGTTQTVSNQLYGNLKFSSTGVAVKTLPATNLTIQGNLSSVLGGGTSLSYTAASNVTINGNTTIGTNTVFNGGSFSHSIGGNWSNTGTFTGSTSTITFVGSGSTIGGSGTQNFNNLTVAATLISFLNNNITVAGNLATTGSGSFTQVSGGTLTLSGTSKTISGLGISLNNLTVSGSISTANSFALTGNLNVSGTFTGSSGILTMSGTSKTISGAGTKSLAGLTIAGSITTAVNFSISNNLTVNGSLSATAGNATFTGTSTLSGTANLFNIILNGSSLQLSGNSTLGIANLLTITAGSLNVTSTIPNTVNFNGSGAQNINTISYHNLNLSTGGNKTALGALTINNALTIGTGATFVSGAFTHTIYTDWTNNGSFTAGTGTIQFVGNQPSVIRGATTFNILTVNNSTPVSSVDCQANISAATVNMTLGILITNAFTLTITGTRTGNGIILGNIKRQHAFTTGVAYAFEGPDNSINFTAVSGVTSVTVAVSKASISDFPFGGSMSRSYNMTVPAGTYSADLRLHYEDEELNGNNESQLVLWNYNGSAWGAIGKTSNSSTSNYVQQTGLTNITNRWTLSYAANVVEWNGNTSTDWNTAANWTVVQGAASTPPSATDIVNLGSVSCPNQPTISSTATVKNINFYNAQAITLSMTSGGTLTTGDISGTWTGNAVHSIHTGSQTLNVNGNLGLSDGVNNHSLNLNVGAGSVNITGSLSQTGNSSIVFSGAGNISVGENFNYVSGTFTPGTGTVVYNGINDQLIGLVGYNNVVINKTAGIALLNGVISMGGNLTITAGELNNFSTISIGGNVSIASGAVLHNHTIINVGGNWDNGGTYIGVGTNVIFNGSGTQTISATTFNNLRINKPVGSTVELTGNVTMNGDLDINSGTFDIKTYDCNRSVQGGTMAIGDSATFIVGANNSPLNFSNGTLSKFSTVIANGTGTQYIFGVDFGNLIFRNAGAKVLVTPIIVNGNLTIESGASFDAGANTITLNGNWTNNGTFTPSTSSMIWSGISMLISGNTTFNHVAVTGVYAILNNVTFNGLLNITSSGSLSGGPSISTTMNGDLINSGVLFTLGSTTFTGNVLQTLSLINAVQTVAITVNFNGSVSPVLNSTSPPQFGFLNINNTAGIHASVGYTIAYGLTVASGSAFYGGPSTHIIQGNVNNNGLISSSGTLNFAPASPKTVDLGSNFTSTGTVDFGGSGILTLAGSATTFNNVTISNSNVSGISPSSGWNMKDLTIAAGSVLDAGNHTFNMTGNLLNNGNLIANSSTFVLNGTIDQDIVSATPLHNLTISKAYGMVTLGSNIEVASVLQFVSGKIVTGNQAIIQPTTGTVTGAGQTSGWVAGNLQRNIDLGPVIDTFQIGDQNYFTPVVVNFADVSVGGDLTASTISGDHALIGTSALSASKTANRTWTLTNNGIVFTRYNVRFHFDTSDLDGSANVSDFIVAKYHEGWTYPRVGSKTSNSIEAVGLYAFSDFQLGEHIPAKVFTGTGIFSDATHWSGGTLPVADDYLKIDGSCTVDNFAGTNNIAYGKLSIGSSASHVLNWASGGTNRLNVTDLSAESFSSTLDMSNGGTLVLRETWNSANLNFIPGMGTIEIQSDMALPVAYDDFHNLTINGYDILVGFDTAITVGGNLSISNGVLDASGNQITIGGNWTSYSNNGFLQNGGGVEFNGSLVQNIATTGGAVFSNLSFSNSGAGVVLQDEVQVTDTLSLSNGNIALNGNFFTLGNSTTDKGTLLRNNGHFTGTGVFKRWFDTGSIGDGSVDGLFPMGTTADYRPFYVSSPTGQTSGGTLAIWYTDVSTNTDVLFHDGITPVIIRKDLFWSLSTGDGFAGGSFNIMASGTGLGTIGNLQDIRLTLVDTVVGSMGLNSGTTSNPMVFRYGLIDSELNNNFYISSSELDSPLPLGILSFNATASKERVKLDWETVSEEKNVSFSLQRSPDANDWTPLTNIKGLGGSEKQSYIYIDQYPPAGIHYYRLIQADQTGKKLFSAVRKVQTGPGIQVNVYPNPTTDYLFITIPENEFVDLQLSTILGKVVEVTTSGTSQGIVLDVSKLSKGTYFLEVIGISRKDVKKVVIH